jgi:hypothetical protein
MVIPVPINASPADPHKLDTGIIGGLDERHRLVADGPHSTVLARAIIGIRAIGIREPLAMEDSGFGEKLGQMDGADFTWIDVIFPADLVRVMGVLHLAASCLWNGVVMNELV